MNLQTFVHYKIEGSKLRVDSFKETGRSVWVET